jgi:hypothetical protein
MWDLLKRIMFAPIPVLKRRKRYRTLSHREKPEGGAMMRELGALKTGAIGSGGKP